MNSTAYILIGAAAFTGFILAWLTRWRSIAKLKKECKSVKGLLESERLIRDTMQKEHAFLLQSADASLLKTNEKLKTAEAVAKQMDRDILLLQKSNEETEYMLKESEPALHDLKLKLIEAQNALARYKAKTG